MPEHTPSESTPEAFSIDEFEALKAVTLRRYGCPQEELWLTECLTVEQFSRFHGYDEALDGYRGVIYHHESGNVTALTGFNNEEEFQRACEYVARSLAKEPMWVAVPKAPEQIPENPYPSLFTAAQWEQLVYNGRLSAVEERDHLPVVRLITLNLRPQMVWVLSEVMPKEPDIGFGLCDLGQGFPELGYVSLREIVSACTARGVILASDPAFRPTRPVSEIAAEARNKGR